MVVPKSFQTGELGTHLFVTNKFSTALPNHKNYLQKAFSYIKHSRIFIKNFFVNMIFYQSFSKIQKNLFFL